MRKVNIVYSDSSMEPSIFRVRENLVKFLKKEDIEINQVINSLSSDSHYKMEKSLANIDLAFGEKSLRFCQQHRPSNYHALFPDVCRLIPTMENVEIRKDTLDKLKFLIQDINNGKLDTKNIFALDKIEETTETNSSFSCVVDKYKITVMENCPEALSPSELFILKTMKEVFGVNKIEVKREN